MLLVKNRTTRKCDLPRKHAPVNPRRPDCLAAQLRLARHTIVKLKVLRDSPRREESATISVNYLSGMRNARIRVKLRNGPGTQYKVARKKKKKTMCPHRAQSVYLVYCSQFHRDYYIDPGRVARTYTSPRPPALRRTWRTSALKIKRAPPLSKHETFLLCARRQAYAAAALTIAS